MTNKNIVSCALGLFIILSLAGSVFALTGAIGNSRMVLRMEKGETIEKYILVKNVNNVSVDIELSASGDLKDSIKIKDKEFSLDVRGEKKAYFTITASKEGSTTSKINIKFTPEGGKNGIGLSSTVIVITNESEVSSSSDFFDESDSEGSSSEEPVDAATSNVIKNSVSVLNGNKVGIALVSTMVIFIILILLLLAKKKRISREGALPNIKQKKRVKEGE